MTVKNVKKNVEGFYICNSENDQLLQQCEEKEQNTDARLLHVCTSANKDAGEEKGDDVG